MAFPFRFFRLVWQLFQIWVYGRQLILANLFDRTGIHMSVTDPPGDVEDIFTQYLIPQIQKLSKNYKLDAENAKSDLFKLVGNKYRDLVEIAEDIRTMHSDSVVIYERLSSLSYRKLTFGDFTNNNPYAKFDSEARKLNAQKSRINSKKTILKNIIYNRLVPIDLELKSPVAESFTDQTKQLLAYMNYSKIYYTIEVVFDDILRTDAFLKDKFDHLKSRYSSHLEVLIAEHNSWIGNYAPQNTTLNTLVRHYIMSVDTGLEELSEFILGDVDIDSSALHNLQTQDLQPLVAYLCAYLILNLNNPDLNTLTKVFEKFAEIRMAYIDSLLNQILEEYKVADDFVVDFLRLFLYFENTCNYIKAYFESPTLQGNLIQTLKKQTENWSATDVIGFRNWFEVESIHFNNQLYEIRIPESSLEAVNEIIMKLVKSISTTFGKLLQTSTAITGSSLSQISETQKLCYNFFVDFSNLNRFCHGQGVKCHMVRILQECHLLSSILEDVATRISQAYNDQLQHLISDSTKMSQKNGSLVESEHLRLFSQPLFETIDNNIDSYLEIMGDIAASTSLIPNSSALGSAHVGQWFLMVNQIHDLLSFPGEATKSGLDGQKMSLLVLAEQLKEVDASSSFCDLVEKKSTSLKERLLNALWSKLETYVHEVVGNFGNENANSNISKRYEFLRILLTLVENLNVLQSRLSAIPGIERNLQKILSNIEDSCKESVCIIFDGVMRHPKTIEVQETLSKYLQETGSFSQFTGLIYQLATVFLAPNDYLYSKEYENIQLYSSPVIKAKFSNLKQDWVLKSLVSPLKEKLNSIKTDQKETTETENKSIQSTQVRTLLSDIYFLLLIVEEELQLNDYSTMVEDEILQGIKKEVSEFYASSKNVFLPLLN